MTRRQISGASSHVVPLPPVMPALLTSASSRPSFDSVESVAASTDAWSVISTASVATLPRVASDARALASCSSLTSQSETVAPEPSIRSAMA